MIRSIKQPIALRTASRVESWTVVQTFTPIDNDSLTDLTPYGFNVSGRAINVQAGDVLMIHWYGEYGTGHIGEAHWFMSAPSYVVVPLRDSSELACAYQVIQFLESGTVLAWADSYVWDQMAGKLFRPRFSAEVVVEQGGSNELYVGQGRVMVNGLGILTWITGSMTYATNPITGPLSVKKGDIIYLPDVEVDESDYSGVDFEVETMLYQYGTSPVYRHSWILVNEDGALDGPLSPKWAQYRVSPVPGGISVQAGVI